jgi:hypothetical protein
MYDLIVELFAFLPTTAFRVRLQVRVSEVPGCWRRPCRELGLQIQRRQTHAAPTVQLLFALEELFRGSSCFR